MSDPQSTPITNLEDVLANMELRALRVSFPDERARIFNLAGDLCFDAGSRERSLSYYGRAIDVYIAAQQMEAAVNTCRKIVRLTPEVVRARCTLAWMALGRGLIQEARTRISEYAEAASAAGKEGAAAHHLRLMTEVAENQDVLESLAEALLQVGDDAGANRAYGAALGRVTARRIHLPDSPEERWTAVLEMLGGFDRSLAEYPPPPVPAAIAAEFQTKRSGRIIEIREEAVARALSAALERPANERPPRGNGNGAGHGNGGSNGNGNGQAEAGNIAVDPDAKPRRRRRRRR